MVTMPTEPAILMVRAFGDATRQLVDLGPLDESGGSRLADALMTAEGIVAAGLASFDSISRVDTAWHTAVFAGTLEYDPRIPSILLDGFRDWHEMAGKFLPTLDELEGKSGPVPGAADLRARLREAAGILAPDGQFFAGEALDRLAADAIVADDRGETVEFLEMGD